MRSVSHFRGTDCLHIFPKPSLFKYLDFPPIFWVYLLGFAKTEGPFERTPHIHNHRSNSYFIIFSCLRFDLEIMAQSHPSFAAGGSGLVHGEGYAGQEPRPPEGQPPAPSAGVRESPHQGPGARRLGFQHIIGVLRSRLLCVYTQSSGFPGFLSVNLNPVYLVDSPGPF